MNFKDYYKVMGLAEKATPADVKQAYRKLAKKFHPDVSKEFGSEARFQEIGEAYEVLSHNGKRADYDRIKTLHANRDGRNNAGTGTARNDDETRRQFRDFFASTFGTGSAGYQGDRPTTDSTKKAAYNYRGKDQHYTLVVRLEEAVKGGRRTLKLNMPTVDARGQQDTESKTLSVKIPAGVEPSQRIRLNGQGRPGFGGGINGDLLLEIKFAPHPLFTIDGRDILLNLPVSPWEAALGAKVEVPTLTSPVNLTIPAGSVSGKKLRLKGRGLGLNPSGDQIITLHVTLPTQHSSKAKVLYQQLAEVETLFNPRKMRQKQL